MARLIHYTCDNCGKPATVYMNLTQFKKLKHHFCSRKCYSEYRKSHPEEYPGWPKSKAYKKITYLSQLYQQHHSIKNNKNFK